MQSDAELVEACIKGDEGAWRAVVNTYSKRVFNLAYRYTGKFDLAEDLTQEIFLRVYQNLRSYKSGSGSLMSWVLKVAQNLIIDQYRKTRHYQQEITSSEELERLDFKEAPGYDPFVRLSEKEKASFIKAGLESLSPELKEAIILRDIEGLSYQEITGMLKIPEGTVKSRINRARIELAKILRKRKAKF